MCGFLERGMPLFSRRGSFGHSIRKGSPFGFNRRGWRFSGKLDGARAATTKFKICEAIFLSGNVVTRPFTIFLDSGSSEFFLISICNTS